MQDFSIRSTGIPSLCFPRRPTRRPVIDTAAKLTDRLTADNGPRRAAASTHTHSATATALPSSRGTLQNDGHSGGRASRGSPEPMNTRVWHMDSGFAVFDHAPE